MGKNLAEALSRKITVDNYLVFSTIISVFLFVRLLHAGVDIFAGYPIIILNTLILLILGRLVIHRVHLFAIFALMMMSLLAAQFSHTATTSVLAQALGITVLSVSYLSVLVTSGLKVPRWLELYSHIAFIIAVFGIGEYALRHLLRYDQLGEPRLKAFFAEPSLFVYTTLPALGYYLNNWVASRRYGAELLIFLLAYVLADSALGYFGMLLLGALTFLRRINMWGILAGLVAIAIILGGLFFASENIRLRATDTANAISGENMRFANGSTFALLSNIYVTASALTDHPVIGVGLGGYGAAYDQYIGQDLETKDLQNIAVGLNKDDANSLFLRVAAELGIVGLIFLFGFLIVCARVRGEPFRTVRNALLPYMIVRMSRYGGYFSVELYFFVGLYLLNYLDYRRSIAKSLLPSGAAAKLA